MLFDRKLICSNKACDWMNLNLSIFCRRARGLVRLVNGLCNIGDVPIEKHKTAK